MIRGNVFFEIEKIEQLALINRLTTDRALFIWRSRFCPRIPSAITIDRPETGLRWHRMGFVAYWRWKSRSPGGRPRIAKEVRDLIRRMARVNDGALHAGSSSESSP